ncbi:MAG: hypothetical protein PVSMB3_08830 [Candidatus Dormibacteraceae bacterium]
MSALVALSLPRMSSRRRASGRLLAAGPSGPYVLVTLTDGLGGAEGWRLIATISSMVWQFEALRPPLAAA